MREQVQRHAGREVRDATHASNAHADGARDGHLGHGGHPDGIGTECREHADFGKGLVRGAEQAGVNAFLEGDSERNRVLP